MNIIDTIKSKVTSLVRHNPNHIKKLEVLVSEEVPVVKAALIAVLDAYLLTKGITPGSLPELAANAALDLVGDAVQAQANAVITSETASSKK